MESLVKPSMAPCPGPISKRDLALKSSEIAHFGVVLGQIISCQPQG
jgi:hypothetical protein